MGFRIQVESTLARVTLWVEGRFDLSQGFALYQYCQPEEGRIRHCVISLAGVTDLRDSGLDWLRMFLRWGTERGIGVQIIDAKPEHAERYRQWNIPVHTPGDHPLFLRLGDSGAEPRFDPDVPLSQSLGRAEA